MLRRIAVLVSIVVFAGVLSGPAAAEAQTNAVCVFTGLAGTLNPSIPNAIPDALDGNVLDFEQGTYIFTGAAACAGLFLGTTRVEPNLPMSSAGYYDNIVCSTGFAHDLDGSSTNVGPLSRVGYEIDFMAGHGELFIGPPGTPSHAVAAGAPPHAGAVGADGSHGSQSGLYTGRGEVEITPGNGSTTPGRDNCLSPAGGGNSGTTSSFQVKGHFGIHDF